MNTTTLAEQAARELLSHRERFVDFAKRRGVGDGDADEVFQRALVRAVLHIDRLRDPERLTAWFYRILRREVARAHERARSLPEPAPEETLERVTAPAGPDADPLATCHCAEPLLEQVRPEYAEILRRVFLGEQSLREAAADLDITPAHAAVRVHRARRAMRRALAAHCGVDSLRACLDCTCDLTARCGANEP
jgi:RNA polymerase sigma-70 factor (ECF subfamily)